MVFTTTKFAALTARVAENLGVPDARVVVVGHPLGGTDEDTIRQWAEAAIDHLVACLTAPR